MSDPSNDKPGKPGQSGQSGQAQRKALEDSEREAARKQPGSYKEEASDDKIVEIGPDLKDDPIKGMDPPGR